MTATGPGQDVGVEALDAFFARTPRLAVAFSGGCDSSFLLAAALRAGCDVKAYGVRTAFQPAFEIDDAKRLAAELGADFELVDADVLAQGEICANGPDRCYRCKTFIFSTILARMAEDGFEVLAMIMSLFKDYRPLALFSWLALLFCLLGLIAGIPVIWEFAATGLVPRLPSALLAVALVSRSTYGTAKVEGRLTSHNARVDRKSVV